MTVAGAPKKISTGYVPRLLQAELHRKLKRFNVLVMHRRFGKTVFCINEMVDQGLRFSKKDPLTGKTLLNPRFAYLAPLYGQAKRVAWDYLKQYTASIPGVTTNEADLRVDIPRPHLGDSIRFTLLGADNPASLKGIYLDGVILDEYAEMNPTAWREVIRPTLSDRKGWAIFIGTPKGQNSFYELYEGAKNGFQQEDGSIFVDKEWASFLYKASETGIIDNAELDSARRSMTEEEFAQEYECSFNAGLVGAYFAKELTKAEEEKRILKLSHDPMLLVDTYWDLGLNDTTAIWFVQSFRNRHRIIDFFEICGVGIPEILAEIKKKPYNFGRWVLPHDVSVRDFSTGKARIQTFQSLGCRHTHIVPRVGKKMESISAARMIFGLCEFDVDKCKLGLKALANYQRKWNAKNNVFEESPLHNWASNAADAFQCFAMGTRQDSNSSQHEPYNGHGELVAETEFNPYDY